MKLLWIALASASLLFSNDAESIQNISQELAKVREEIENLHSQINYKKDRIREELASYATQRTDLEAQINRSTLRVRELQKELSKIATRNKEKNTIQEDLVPVLKDAITALRGTIQQGIPFKLNDRLEALKTIEERLDIGTAMPTKVANQLWAFLEDELRLANETSIYTHILDIGGQEKLTDVLKIGKIAMFFKSKDDATYGAIRRVGNEWKQVMIDDQEKTKMIEELFTSYQKQIRTAQFTIPNILPSGGEK